MKILTIFASFALLLSGCAQVQQGVQKVANGVGVALAAPFNHLNTQWRGKPLSIFEEKFGPATERNAASETLTLTWERTITTRIGGSWHEDAVAYSPTVTIRKRYYVPEHDDQVSCRVALVVKSGQIEQVKTLSDYTVPVPKKMLDTSVCQIVVVL